LLRGQPGVSADTKEALRWLARSGGHGNTDSMLQLANILLDGLAGAEKQPEEGYRWLMRAAMLDEPRAQEKLSQVLATGKDAEGHALWGPYENISGLRRPAAGEPLIPIDLVESDKWFRLGARSPWYDNPQIRSMIEPRMTSAQLEEARRRVANWKKSTLPEVMAMDFKPVEAK
jgi:localization factor PodJL